jgi:hypothetical protein
MALFLNPGNAMSPAGEALLHRACTDLGLEPLPRVAAGASGASRLLVQATFEPLRCITLVFGLDRIAVQVAGFANAQSHRIDAEAASVHCENAPEVCASWASFMALVASLPSVERMTYDGVRYAHEFWSQDRAGRSSWLNPTSIDHALQQLVVRTYAELCEAAGLRRLVQLRRRAR